MLLSDWIWDSLIFIVLFIGLAVVIGGAAWLLEHEDGEVHEHAPSAEH